MQNIIENFIESNKKNIFSWIRDKKEEKIYNNFPIYSSIDVRISANKIAHVDSNIFPAGFNLISRSSADLAKKEFALYIKERFDNVKNILLIPESYSRNLHYQENVLRIQEIVRNAGFKCEIGLLDSDAEGNIDDNPNAIIKYEKKIALNNGFVPDLILLNNDLIMGVPKIIIDIEQPVIPNVNLGWHIRKKREHVLEYNKIAKEFSDHFGIDPWLISTNFDYIDNIDLHSGQGIDKISEKISKLIDDISEKYKFYKISHKAELYIKAESSTHGLGMIKISKPEDLLSLNKKSRKTMQFTKYKTKITNIMIQEAIPSIERIGNAISESTCYIVNGKLIGGFNRYHKDKGITDNLNSTGAEFKPFTENQINQSSLSCISQLSSLANSAETQ